MLCGGVSSSWCNVLWSGLLRGFFSRTNGLPLRSGGYFSTISWFLGGLALIAAAICFEQDAKLATGLVGCLYLFGAVGNLWATRGRHPGWMLMAAALILIVFGVSKSSG
jgi:hypothetical protein